MIIIINRVIAIIHILLPKSNIKFKVSSLILLHLVLDREELHNLSQLRGELAGTLPFFVEYSFI
ncbi:hypothetical protein D3C73_1643160 [compost metagenome]